MSASEVPPNIEVARSGENLVAPPVMPKRTSLTMLRVSDERIDARDLAVGGGERHEVLRSAGPLENALFRRRAHDRPGVGDRARRSELLVVDEEERVVAAVIEAGNAHRAADAESRLVVGL